MSETEYDVLGGVPDDLIDKMETWTIVDVQRRYRWVSERLIELQNDRRKIAEELPELGKAYTLAYAESRIAHKIAASELGTKITVSDLDDLATVETADAKLALDLAKERKSALNISIETFYRVLDILRSVNKDARIGEGVPR